MSSCECHGLQHYADALGFNLCISLVVHLGTLHLNGFDRFRSFVLSSRMFIRRLNSDIIA